MNDAWLPMPWQSMAIRSPTGTLLRMLALAEHPFHQARALLARQEFAERRQLLGGDPARGQQVLDLLEAELDGLLLAGIVGVPHDPGDRSDQAVEIRCVVHRRARTTPVLAEAGRVEPTRTALMSGPDARPREALAENSRTSV